MGESLKVDVIYWVAFIYKRRMRAGSKKNFRNQRTWKYLIFHLMDAFTQSPHREKGEPICWDQSIDRMTYEVILRETTMDFDLSMFSTSTASNTGYAVPRARHLLHYILSLSGFLASPMQSPFDGFLSTPGLRNDSAPDSTSPPPLTVTIPVPSSTIPPV